MLRAWSVGRGCRLTRSRVVYSCVSASRSLTRGSHARPSQRRDGKDFGGGWTGLHWPVQERLEALPCLADQDGMEADVWHRTSLGDLSGAVKGVELAKAERNVQGRRIVALLLEALHKGLGERKEARARWRKSSLPLLRSARVRGSGRSCAAQEARASGTAEDVPEGCAVDVGEGTESDEGEGGGDEAAGAERAEDARGSQEQVLPTGAEETGVESYDLGGTSVNTGMAHRTIVTSAWPYDALEGDELSFKKGDQFAVLDKGEDSGWIYVQQLGGNAAGCRGLIPSTHLEAVTAAWAWEAQEEDELSFRKGDKLTILGPGEDEVMLLARLLCKC